MSRDRAAYMREYRAIQRAKVKRSEEPVTMGRMDALDRIRELEAEVARLKRELALRPGPAFNSKPFTPVPKGR
jgi:hypothetical protein